MTLTTGMLCLRHPCRIEVTPRVAAVSLYHFFLKKLMHINLVTYKKMTTRTKCT